MSNTELSPSSTIQISASPANLLITVDESSILLEVLQTNNSSMAFFFVLSNNEISYDEALYDLASPILPPLLHLLTDCF